MSDDAADRSRHILATTTAMLNIIAEEATNLERLATETTDRETRREAPFLHAVMVISAKFLRDLHDAAAADLERRRAIVTPVAGLVAFDGQPIDLPRPARRHAARNGVQVIPGGKP